MKYSTPVFWIEMAILTYCVVHATKTRSRLAMWAAIVIVAHNVLLATHDIGALAFTSVICILIYFGLLKLWPAAARVWLCIGGALAGALLFAAAATSTIMLFRDGWNMFGVVFWLSPLFAAPGLLIGSWVAYNWTEPTQLSESGPSE